MFTRRNFHAEQLFFSVCFALNLTFKFLFFLAVVLRGGAGGLDLLLKFFLFCLFVLGAGGNIWARDNCANSALRARKIARNERRAHIFSLVLHTTSTSLCADII